MNDFTKKQCADAVAKLSPQQIVVLRAMMDGLPTKQIAAELELTENTVKVYRERIFSRLGVTNLALAVRVGTLGGIGAP